MIIHADILDYCATSDDPLFHAALMDAPYELREISDYELERAISGDAKQGKGFMGRSWDATGLVFNPRVWEAIASRLLPGAYLFVFGGTLNDDLISLAMRRAGLRKHHKMLSWAYLSGFPKATRIDVQLDRAAGAERAVVGQRKHAPKFDAARHGYREKDNGYNSREREAFDVTAPATDLAAAWEGHRYGLQALKPAVEPIIVFQKPYQGKPVECIARTGAGALNIDAGRIGTEVETWPASRSYGKGHMALSSRGVGAAETQGTGDAPAGRWPANLVLDEAAAAALGAQSGETGNGYRANASTQSGSAFHNNAGVGERGHNDTGTAARMFFQSDWMAERLEAADAVAYVAKASTAEREAGLDPAQMRLMAQLYGDAVLDGVTPERADPGALRDGGRGYIADAFPETTVDDGRQTPIDNPYLRGETTRRNTHPTIKPISLARHLASLLLPPDLYTPRRLLVPFAGAGSEVIGAMLVGWEAITGVELDAQHVAIANARIRYWSQRRHLLSQGKITTRAARPVAAEQESLL